MASPFPGSPDTDATLYVAADNIQTVLSVAQNPTDTVAIVASTTGWVANMILTVDNEQELVTGVVGSNTLQVTRNTNGTGAVLHAAGAKVANLINAAYHNALSSAVKAIEGSMTGAITWPGTVSYQSSDGVFLQNFNDRTQGVGVYRQFGTAAAPMSPLQLGEYGKYYQDVGADGTNTFAAVTIQGHLCKGAGNCYVGLQAFSSAEGTWSPGSGAVGIATKGAIGGGLSATTSQGGYALGALIVASSTNVAASAVSGIEVNVTCSSNSAGQTGVLVVAMGGGGTITGPAATNYGFGLTAIAGSTLFAYGLLFQASGAFPITPSGTIIASLTGACANGLDFSSVTFSGNAIATRGFIVDGSGNVTCGSLNFINVETGANNAIAGSASAGMISGIQMTILLAHTLQAGPNTFNYNAGGPKPIRSSRNPANNIATAYAVGGVIRLLWDGTEWLDLSQ